MIIYKIQVSPQSEIRIFWRKSSLIRYIPSPRKSAVAEQRNRACATEYLRTNLTDSAQSNPAKHLTSLTFPQKLGVFGCFWRRAALALHRYPVRHNFFISCIRHLLLTFACGTCVLLTYVLITSRICFFIQSYGIVFTSQARVLQGVSYRCASLAVNEEVSRQ
jgi:hypothetical protein